MATRAAVFARHVADSSQTPPQPPSLAAAPVSALSLFHPPGVPLKPVYDFVIVGAGSSGAALASELAKKLPKASILLIEAGPTNQVFQVRSPFITCPNLQNSERDWAYRTTPQPKQQNRQSYWPRGKTLGGSSSINFMLHVRGDPKGYDEWANKHGCGPQWSFAALEEHFIGLENYLGSRFLPRRGKRGAIQVRDIRDEPTCTTRPVLQAFVDGCAANGIPETEDYNAPRSHIGAAMSQTSITKDGLRSDTASGYLFDPEHGALHHCPNLSVLCNAQVAKLQIAQGPRCTGVILMSGHTIVANEVILSAGAVGSPHILLLSGIGPRAHLESKGVTVVKDLPGVGRNMKDHIMLGVGFEAPPEMPVFRPNKPTEIISQLARHLVFGDGVLSQSWVQAMAFTRSSICESSAANDIQIHFVPLLGVDEEMNKRNFGFDREKHIMAAKKDVEGGLTMMPSLLQPKSEGYIELRTNNPADHPIIEPNYLAHPDDLEVLVQAYELARKVGAHMKVKELVDETIPHPFESREYMAAKLTRDIVTIYHPTTTCKMGPASNPMSVLDPDTMRVWGVAGLRVVDCASMPELPAANTNVPAIMLGVKAADMIAKSWTGRA